MEINTRTYDQWRELMADDRRTARALADWLADILTVLRVVHSAGVTGLMDPTATDGDTCRDVEQAYLRLLRYVPEHVGSATEVTFSRLLTWDALAQADPKAALCDLADEFARMLYVMNVVSANVCLHWVASEREYMPYSHVKAAHIAVLTLLAGDAGDGQRLHNLWSDNQSDTAWNQAVLAEQKRAASVIVTVRPGGVTATVQLPRDATVYEAGQVGGGDGPCWVADECGTVVGHSPAWAGVGQLLADHYRVSTSTVLVEYAADKARD